MIRKTESAEWYPPVAPQSFGLGLEEDERKSSGQGEFCLVGWIDIYIDIYIFFCIFNFLLVLIVVSSFFPLWQEEEKKMKKKQKVFYF